MGCRVVRATGCRPFARAQHLQEERVKVLEGQTHREGTIRRFEASLTAVSLRSSDDLWATFHVGQLFVMQPSAK